MKMKFNVNTSKFQVRVVGLFNSIDQIEPSLYIELSGNKNIEKLNKTMKKLNFTSEWKTLYLNPDPAIQQFVANREFLKFVNYLATSDYKFKSEAIAVKSNLLLAELDTQITVRSKDKHNNQSVLPNTDTAVFAKANMLFNVKFAKILSEIPSAQARATQNFYDLFGVNNLDILKIEASSLVSEVHMNELITVANEWALRTFLFRKTSDIPTELLNQWENEFFQYLNSAEFKSKVKVTTIVELTDNGVTSTFHLTTSVPLTEMSTTQAKQVMSHLVQQPRIKQLNQKFILDKHAQHIKHIQAQKAKEVNESVANLANKLGLTVAQLKSML